MFVGRGRITQFNEDTFTAGKPHTIEIECDLWPEITYAGGYKNMEVTVNASPIDMEKYEQVKQNIRERYKELTDTPPGKAAEMGDVLIANMKGFERMPDGSKGDQLPAVAGGDGVEILLEKGKNSAKNSLTNLDHEFKSLSWISIYYLEMPTPNHLITFF